MRIWILTLLLLAMVYPRGPVWAHEGHDSAFGSKDALTAVSKRIKLDPEGIKAIGLKTEPVKLTTLKRSLKANGEVRAADNRIYDVFPSSSGVIETVSVKEGDSVSKGQLLASVRSVEIAATVAQLLQERTKALSDLRRTQSEYKNEITVSEKTVEHAEADFRREEALLKEGITARKNYVDAKHEFDTQSVKLSALRNRLKEEITLQDKQVKTITESVKSQLKVMGLSSAAINQALSTGTVSASINIFSPVSGTVSQSDTSIGATVNKDRKIFSIMNLSPIWVELQIFQQDIHLIHLRQPVSMITASGSRVDGKVELIGASLNPETKTLPVRVVSLNRNGQLRPGMFVTSELTTGKSNNHILVPATAVIEKDGQATVYVQTGQYFEAVPVKVATADGSDIREVIDGIFEGDQVVVSGAKQLLAQSMLSANSDGAKEFSKVEEKSKSSSKRSFDNWFVAALTIGCGLLAGLSGLFIGMKMSKKSASQESSNRSELDKIC